MQRLRWLLGGVLGLSMLGCGGPRAGEFSGSIQFFNKSGVAVDWVRTVGFDALPGMGSDIGPGRFGKDAEASLALGRMRYPERCTIFWRYQPGEKEHQQVLNLHEIAPEKRVGTLAFRFGKNKQWEFGFVPSPEYLK